MAIQMLSAAEAVQRITSCNSNGKRLLGVDGFQIVSEGYIGRLDLILDLSSPMQEPEAAERIALKFVSEHAARDIMFEVVEG
jgi:hypothetical protein